MKVLKDAGNRSSCKLKKQHAAKGPDDGIG